MAFCLLASSLAVIWSWRHDAMLNYGDAVAHLHIARRVLDSRTARFTQLGSVWLPLPHILLIPFVQNFQWWATGLAGVIPSALAYITACAGIYRLARHWMSVSASALALCFFALNPNLLYLQTTAMTEPLFLCETIWIVVWMVEWHAALNEEMQTASFNLGSTEEEHHGPRRPLRLLSRRPLRIFEAGQRNRGARLRNPASRPGAKSEVFLTRSSQLQAAVAATLVAAIFTRYDGWIIAVIVWTGMGLMLRRYRQLDSRAFWWLSIAVIAAPMLWFLYNAVGFGDWLYFARGPFSAKAIEMRTAVPGWPPHPGWHNLWVAFLYYVKVCELDCAALKWGNVLLALATLGTGVAWVAQKPDAQLECGRGSFAWLLLLWLPVPFYAYSVAYGSVPIFFPAWWPYTLYNTRYGLELLPALAIGVGFAAQGASEMVRRIHVPQSGGLARVSKILPGVAIVLLFVLVGMNFVEMFAQGPVVYAESLGNLKARLPYDEAIPPVLQDLLSLMPGAPVLMNTSAYPEIVALTGIPLRETINESDLDVFQAALDAPAQHAAIVVAFAGDEVDRAVKANSSGLLLSGRFAATGQPTASIYLSSKWVNQSPLMKLPEPTEPVVPEKESPQAPAQRSRDVPQNKIPHAASQP